MSSPIKVHYNASTGFLLEPISFTIVYVNPDIAAKRVAEHDTALFSWRWHGDDESVHPIVTSTVNMTILSIVNAAFAGLPNPSRKIRELWGCREKHNHQQNVNRSGSNTQTS